MSPSNRAVFLHPAVFVIATLAGLAAGLLGDGFEWLVLDDPVVAIVTKLSRGGVSVPVKQPH